MRDAQIDETKLRQLLTDAADLGFRIAWDSLGEETQDARGQRLSSEQDEAIAFNHSQLLRRALELVPSHAVDLAEPPLYWSLQEVLEWTVYGGSPTRRDVGPPLTWEPKPRWKGHSIDDMVESRLHLLRVELADVGIAVSAPAKEGGDL